MRLVRVRPRLIGERLTLAGAMPHALRRGHAESGHQRHGERERVPHGRAVRILRLGRHEGAVLVAAPVITRPASGAATKGRRRRH
ncbi:hypothetical protein ACQEUU_37755 [Nonomuraea sp. CA-218870]|uniref:hypothetical protein n=1 Tax=Nonomuraea sp. CA-218870 TaxID=3239998 RepID=UPI003D8BBF85